MWRRLEKAVQSSCKRSVRSCHRNIVQGLKYNEKSVLPLISSLYCEEVKISCFSMPCRHYDAFRSSSKRNSCEGEAQPRSAGRNWEKASLLDRIPEFKNFPGRGFMCKAGIYKDAEMEENEHHDYEEDGSKDGGEEMKENESHESWEDGSMCRAVFGEDAEKEDDECHEIEANVSEIDEFEGAFPKLAAASVEKLPKDLVATRELLWKRILRVTAKPPGEVMAVIKDWKEEGKELKKRFLVAYITRLRKRARYKHALEISDWLVNEKPFELDSMDYSVHIDLTARAGQMHKVEQLFNELLPEHKNVLAYSTILMNYVKRGMLKKAEETFEEIKKLGLTSTFTINQMLRLYHSKGMKEKVPSLLDLADSSGLQPDVFRYNLLMDIEGKAGNIAAMEKIYEEAKANPKVKLDAKSLGVIASAYIGANMRDKAELALKRMEMGDYFKTPAMYNALLKLYGQLKLPDDVERIWKVTKRLPKRSNYSVACLLNAFGSLDSAKGAETAFKDMEQMIRSSERGSTPASVKKLKLLNKLYEKFGLNEKAEELTKNIPISKAPSDAVALQTTVEDFLKSDELEKAYEALNTRNGGRQRPLFDTYILILTKYAEKGDVKMCEKIFEACRRANYGKNIKLWNTLLKGYLKASFPVYGFQQRMYADRVYPTTETRKLLGDMKQLTK